MAKRNTQLLIRLLLILVPTYIVAFITNAMIYTMPMLAACTLLAANLFNDDETEIRVDEDGGCLLYTSPSPRDGLLSRMPSSA